MTWQPSLAAVIVADVSGPLVGDVAEGQLADMADLIAVDGRAGRAAAKQPRAVDPAGQLDRLDAATVVPSDEAWVRSPKDLRN